MVNSFSPAPSHLGSPSRCPYCPHSSSESFSFCLWCTCRAAQSKQAKCFFNSPFRNLLHVIKQLNYCNVEYEMEKHFLCGFITSSLVSLSRSLRLIFCMSSIFWRTASAVLSDNQGKNLKQILNCAYLITHHLSLHTNSPLCVS